MASSEDQRPRAKRRRGTDKRFVCTHEGCGRHYSRAEHLQRHKLNHSPKTYYHCGHPNCTLSFVRKDLCLRHRSRHGKQQETPSSAVVPDDPAAAISSQSLLSVHGDDARTLPRINIASPDPRQQNGGDAPPIADERDQQTGDIDAADDRFSQLSSTADCFAHISLQPLSALVTEGRAQRGDSLDDRPRFDGVGGLSNEQSFGISPCITDEFTAWLFDSHEQLHGLSYFSDAVLDDTTMQSSDLARQYFGLVERLTPVQGRPEQDFLRLPSPSITSQSTGLSSPRYTRLSLEKRQVLIDIISQRFLDANLDLTKNVREELFASDLDDPEHPLSLSCMELFLQSYWDNFHCQLPILHRPTFDPDCVHDYLLLAVMALGAAQLRRNNTTLRLLERAIKFANVVAYNVRWHVVMHAEANPPGSLWAIQTLLLLEMYEKLNSTRALHERAHIYFPATLTLMRRSSALFGKQFLVASHAPSLAATPRPFQAARESTPLAEPWWQQWIAREAMRRAALAAFLIDSTHAVMFGHSPTLVIHELQVQLPCDNILWSSSSPSEIGSVESCLYAHGVRPTSFLDALKRILNSQGVRTNAFGRIILMAGLLSVSCQMRQRDLYGTCLGGEGALGFQEKWQPKLIKAFDWWMKDFDHRIDLVERATDWQKHWFRRESGRDHADAFLPLGTVLYHLGHMSIHLTMPELCIYAGTDMILGRIVSDSEKKKVRDKVERWATSVSTSNDIYHALKLIKYVLFSTVSVTSEAEGCEFDQRGRSWSPPLELPEDRSFNAIYDVSRDTLLNRPWVLFFATLLVWTYGYALDGTLKSYPSQLEYPPPTQTGKPTPAGLRTRDQSGLPIHGTSMDRREASSKDQPGCLNNGLFNQVQPNANARSLKQARYHDLRNYLQALLPDSVCSSEALLV